MNDLRFWIRPALACIVLGLLGPAPCIASHISLRIQPESRYSHGRGELAVEITNKGDEPARSVWVEASVGERVCRSEIEPSLAVDATHSTVLDLGIVPSPPGTYTVVTKVHYTDANGYPFSALRSIPIVTAAVDPTSEGVAAQLSSMRMKEHGEIVLACSTRDNTAADVKITLILPEALACDMPVRTVSVPADGEKTVRFAVRDLWTRPGSRYCVFAVIDYSAAGQHRSITAQGEILMMPVWRLPSFNKAWWYALIIPMFAGFLGLQFLRLPWLRMPRGLVRIVNHGAALPIVALCAILGFTLYHVPLAYLLRDTLTTGGDTPAHHYLASHLKHQLFNHGRIVSWGGGWWCGFPMFQYYFCLPYLLMAVGSCLVPYNIAFKLVTVAGIICLPASAYASGRILRLPRPVPTLLAIAMVPLLFDRSHTMWGVNIYSTLAGMIANSISFPVMLVFIASAIRDVDDGRARLSTVLLLAALVASHFFTSLASAITVAILPFLRPRSGFVKGALVLVQEYGLAFLLMAWWIVPLLAKQQYSMDFGYNWDVSVYEHLTKHVPVAALWLTLCLPVAALAVTPLRHGRFILVVVWMLVSSVALFMFGYTHVSPVFVNVRFWPFIVYALLALTATSIGLLMTGLKAQWLAVLAILVAVLVFGPGTPNHVRVWAEWNYSGLEKKPGMAVFNELVLPLKGTPGRLANDLHGDNHSAFGSTRIFECVPHMTGKPILEGGIVNSALGSMVSYYVQGETSRNCAGHPNIVIPASFNFTNATKHLALLNVKHFIARYKGTKDALALSDDWRLIKGLRGWELHELLSHDGSYVYVPSNYPVAINTDFSTELWKENALAWLYTIDAIDQPFALIDGEARAGFAAELGRPVDQARFRQYLCSVGPRTGDIREWLLLGPFPYPPGTEQPIEFEPIQEPGIDPVQGDLLGGRNWRVAPLRVPVMPARFFNRKDGLLSCDRTITYGYSNIFSPVDREATMHFACDDGARIWLNNELVTTSGIVGLGCFATVDITLRKGRNRVLVKNMQIAGGQFFRVRITDRAGRPFDDMTFSSDRNRPVVPAVHARPIDRAGVKIVEQDVSDNSIRFRTNAVGLPHIIKCTFYPNWKVRGAAAVYPVTPCFMLVYPECEEVELYYGYTLVDNIGRGASLLGAILFGIVAWCRRRRKTATSGQS